MKHQLDLIFFVLLLAFQLRSKICEIFQDVLIGNFFILEIETKFLFNKKSLEFKQNANSSMGSNGTMSNSTQMNITEMMTTMETISTTMTSLISTTMTSLISTTMNMTTTQNDSQTDCSSMSTTSSTTMAWVDLDG